MTVTSTPSRVPVARARELASRFSKAKVAVVGDFVADVYLSGSPARLSREAPVLVIRYESEDLIPGSAANVVNNLSALGASVVPAGLIGKDREGDRLVAYFRERGIAVDHILRDPKVGTITKMRVMAGDVNRQKQQIVRIDREPFEPFSEELARELTARVEQIVPRVEGVILSDYGYATISPAIIDRVREKGRGKILVADSHTRLREFRGFTAITPNEGEAELAAGFPIRHGEDADRAGEALLRSIEVSEVLLTRGNKGMSLFRDKKKPLHLPILGGQEIVDVSGAGDTVAAVYVLVRVAGGEAEEAAYLSNAAASVVVMKSRAATLGIEELVAAVEKDWNKGH
jgi:rfaE bifunctional protein kinase chain/domain